MRKAPPFQQDSRMLLKAACAIIVWLSRSPYHLGYKPCIPPRRHIIVIQLPVPDPATGAWGIRWATGLLRGLHKHADWITGVIVALSIHSTPWPSCLA